MSPIGIALLVDESSVHVANTIITADATHSEDEDDVTVEKHKYIAVKQVISTDLKLHGLALDHQ